MYTSIKGVISTFLKLEDIKGWPIKYNLIIKRGIWQEPIGELVGVRRNIGKVGLN